MRPRPKKRYQQVIDGSELFESEEIKEFDFGEVEIEEVQICEMGVKEVDGEIRYKSIGAIGLTSLEEKTRDIVAATTSEQVKGNDELEDLEVSVEIETEKH
jgi:hypothetical protein